MDVQRTSVALCRVRRPSPYIAIQTSTKPVQRFSLKKKKKSALRVRRRHVCFVVDGRVSQATAS